MSETESHDHDHDHDVDELHISKSLGIHLLISIQAIYLLILSPISLYYAYKFHKLSQQNICFFTKRHPKLVLFTILIYNIYPLIIRPISDFLWIFHLSGFINMPQSSDFIPFFLSMTIHPIAYLNVTRIWILYFDYNRCLQSLSKIWKTQITHKKNYKPWTLKYPKLGSIKISLISWALFSLILLSFLGIMMGILLHRSPLLPYLQAVAVLPPIFLSIMIFKIRKSRDQFALKREFIWLLCVNLYVVIVYGGVIIPFFHVSSVSRIIIINIVTSVGCYGLSYISTWWVIRKYYKQKKSFQEQSEQTVENKEHKNMSLEDILCTKDGFDLFADHLVREFCIESLLFLFEMMQIKSQLIAKNLLDEDKVGIIVKMTTQRIQKTRRDSGNIISIDTMKTNLKHIIDQYIVCNSDYSINISSRTRTKLLSLFAKVKDQVYNVPKYGWIKTSNIYQSTSKHIGSQASGNDPDLYDDESALDLQMSNISSKENITVPRMNAIDDIKIEPLSEAPTLDWIDASGNNTLELEKNEKDSKLMIEYLQAFDKAIIEISSLLQGDTLLRFYSTNDYQRVLKHFMCLMNTNRTQSE